MTIKSFQPSEIEQLAKVLGEAATGTELTALFGEAGIEDPLGRIKNPYGQGTISMTKWRRINEALCQRQEKDRCANQVLAFAERVLNPRRFALKDPAVHEHLISEANTILGFQGLALGTDGILKKTEAVSTVLEAQRKADRLKAELTRRNVHHDLLRFCRAELLDKNYFHAVLEATKSLAQKLRDRTGLNTDGSALVDAAFNTQKPLLVWNELDTDSKKSEHIGMMFLMKGMFSLYRNPQAHEPKILREITENQAFEAFTLISFLHRKVDEAARTSF